ncbi:zinc-binding alcohol dehydrogenase family protein [Spirochaetota bacterium]
MEGTMKSILAKGGSSAVDAEAFYILEQPIPRPGDNDVLVRVLAIGMNPVDTKIRKRSEQDKVLGWDAYGIVEETGTAVPGFKEGDRVFYSGSMTRPGCNSEYQVVDHRLAAIAPQNLSPADAVAMPLTAITAWEGLFDRLGFIPNTHANTGKSILIIGAAGGVGSIAIQLAHWAGLTVYATASRPETAQWCTTLGADHVIDHKASLSQELEASGIKTVDAIFCTTQIEMHWNAMAECIGPQGSIVFIDDPASPLDIRIFKQKSVRLSWEFMFCRSLFETDDMAAQGAALARVAGLLDAGILVTTQQRILQGLSPDNIRSMHIYQEKGTMIGKQVLVL